MKKYFEIVGIIMLLTFSFYYTDKVASLTKNNDVLMTSIEKNKEKYECACAEGTITSEGIILGKSGRKVDEKRSYNNMIGKSFNKDLLIYYNVPCLIKKEDNYDKYIISGNPYKNSVTLIINVTTGNYLEKILSVSFLSGVKVDIMLNYNNYEDNRLYYKELLKNDYYFVYKGNKEYIDDFNKVFENKFVCTTIETCLKYKINSIKVNKSYNKNYLNNIKKDLSKGDFIVLEESESLLDELSVIIKYIKAKGINIISLKEHL